MPGRLELGFLILLQTAKFASSAGVALNSSLTLWRALRLSSPLSRPSTLSSSREKFSSGFLSPCRTTLPASLMLTSLPPPPRPPISFLLLVRATFSTALSSFLLGPPWFASNSYLGGFEFLAKSLGQNFGANLQNPFPLLPPLADAGMVVGFAPSPLQFFPVGLTCPHPQARELVRPPTSP